MSEASPQQPTSVAHQASAQQSLQDVEFSWATARHIVGSGFAMGSADVVPGVSGGTMAVACGIYERLLAAIATINAESVKALLKFQWRELLGLVHWRFLAMLFLGIISAVVVMVKIVGLPGLLVSHPTLVYSVFFGLVAASVFVLGKDIKWTVVAWVSLLFGTAFGWLVVNLVPMDMPGSPFHMFLYGVVAISAMLLPGISGSFILLILGQYERVIGAIESLLHLDFSALLIVVPFALGCLVGITAFARIVAWALRRFHAPVVAGLCGLLIGSLWRIWPYQETISREVRGKIKIVEAHPFIPETWDVSVPLLILAGFAIVFLVEFLAKRRTASA